MPRWPSLDSGVLGFGCAWLVAVREPLGPVVRERVAYFRGVRRGSYFSSTITALWRPETSCSEWLRLRELNRISPG